VFTVRAYASPAAFLGRAQGWLMRHEDRHNLMLSLAMVRARREGTGDADTGLYATVEEPHTGGIVGCVVRTPPHKVLITELPTDAARAVASFLAQRYSEIPAVLGPVGAAGALARAWAERSSDDVQPGMAQGVYRLDAVRRPRQVEGRLRAATVADAELAVRWGEDFAQETGIPFPPSRDTVGRWIEGGTLHVWEADTRPVSIAVAHGRTPRGVRIGYVYTPRERRGRGYASAVVARLSQKMLDGGCAFCVLYTDLSNPTSNAIYQRIGYRLLETVQDFELVPRRGT
jgi:RimJ/RimL family protein N-acetyltransferase